MGDADGAPDDRPVLIDTSAWIETLVPDGDPACRARVEDLVISGRAATCEIIMAEVLRGASDATEADRLEQGLRELILLPCDGAGGAAARMGRKLRAPRGRLADLLIAAVALGHDAFILTRDRHLSHIAATFGIGEEGLG